MSSSTRFRANVPRITHETLEDEVILVDFESGTYFGLHGVATYIWSTFAGFPSIDDIIGSVQKRYDSVDESQEKEIVAFVEDLVSHELLVPCTAGESEAPQGDGNGPAPTTEEPPYSTPLLEKHTDMRDLLLLDPIHEVQEEGWPRSNKGKNK